MSLFFERRLRALNSEDVRFSGSSRSLEKFWYEVSAVCSSMVLKTLVQITRKASRGSGIDEIVF